MTVPAWRRWRAAWPLAVLGIAALLLALAGDWSSPALRYERSAILDGEAWRLLSGHLVHLSLSHLLLNLAGLGMVMLLFGQGVAARDWGWLLAGSWLVMSVGFLWLEPGIGWYVGLSGLLHGLIIGGAWRDVAFPCLERNILVLIVVAKLGWEQAFGVLPFTAEAAGGPVVVDAHFYGAIGGALGAVVLWYAGRVRERRRSRV